MQYTIIAIALEIVHSKQAQHDEPALICTQESV